MRWAEGSELAGAGSCFRPGALTGTSKEFVGLIIKPSLASRKIRKFLSSFQYTITKHLPAKHPHHPPIVPVPTWDPRLLWLPCGQHLPRCWDSGPWTCQQRPTPLTPTLPRGRCPLWGSLHTWPRSGKAPCRHSPLAPLSTRSARLPPAWPALHTVRGTHRVPRPFQALVTCEEQTPSGHTPAPGGPNSSLCSDLSGEPWDPGHRSPAGGREPSGIHAWARDPNSAPISLCTHRVEPSGWPRQGKAMKPGRPALQGGAGPGRGGSSPQQRL